MGRKSLNEYCSNSKSGQKLFASLCLCATVQIDWLKILKAKNKFEDLS